MHQVKVGVFCRMNLMVHDQSDPDSLVIIDFESAKLPQYQFHPGGQWGRVVDVLCLCRLQGTAGLYVFVTFNRYDRKDALAAPCYFFSLQFAFFLRCKHLRLCWRRWGILIVGLILNRLKNEWIPDTVQSRVMRAT